MKSLIGNDSEQEEGVAEQYDYIIQSGKDKRNNGLLRRQIEALKRQIR